MPEIAGNAPVAPSASMAPALPILPVPPIPPVMSAPPPWSPPPPPPAFADPPSFHDASPPVSAEASAMLTGSFASLVWKCLGPAWLASMTAHLATLLGLALLHVAEPAQHRNEMVLVALPNEEEEIASFELVEFQSLAAETLATSVPQISFPSLGGAIARNDVAVTLDAAPLEVAAPGPSALADVGSLFKRLGREVASARPREESAEFFGVKAEGRRFVFIVDSSRSMWGGKFQAACEELSRAVRRLDKTQSFYVMFFDWDCARMVLDDYGPAAHDVAATPDNFRALDRWIKTIELELKTEPLECLKFALEKLRPDAVYLLTDGQFTDGGATMRYLRNNNFVENELEGRVPKMVIHTIGFYERDGEPALEAIARDYGGTYRFVPPPDQKESRRRK